MNVLAIDYGTLLANAKPEVVHDEAKNEEYIRILESLAIKKELTPAEEKLAELLGVLIDDFEAKHYELEKANPVEVVRHLMEENGLRQKDLVGVLGGAESGISEVLNGKRPLTASHIKRLSERFGVSPSVFF
jgi:HTH-type transcriptional regulator/antitoxin HigA